MTNKIAIIGAGAASMAAITTLLDKGSGEELIDVYEARSRWGGRTLTEDVGKDPIDFGAEAIENDDSAWKDLLAKTNTNLVWDSKMSNPASGLYWANGEVQTKEQAVGAEDTFDKLPKNVIKTIENQIEFSKVDVAAANPQICKSPADLLKVGMYFTSSESIEPWIFSAVDKRRFQSASTELYPYLSTTGARQGLGATFASYGAYLTSQAGGRITTNWGRKVLAIEASQDAKNPGFTVTSDGGQAPGYDAVIVTIPVSLIDQLVLPFSGQKIVSETTQGIKLGHYLKVGYSWPEAINYCTGGSNKGLRVWFADPLGQYLWQLQAFPDSNALVASTTGGFAKQASSNPDNTALVLEAQLRDVFNNISGPSETVTYSWSDHPYSQGCYSYCTAGHAQNRVAFSELYFPGIYFAGEAQSIGFYGQLDGAYEAGVSAAEKLLDYLEQLA